MGTICAIGAILLTLTFAAIVCIKSNDEIDMFPVVVIMFLMFVFGTVVGSETNTNTNITTQNITTYTYQCQICEETTTTTEEPQIMICDECIEAIKNIEREEKE